MKVEVNKLEKSLEFYTTYYSPKCNIPQSVDSNGKEYTLLDTQSSSYSWIERVRLIIITVFSFGTALFSAEVRKNWLMMLSNRKIEVRYKLNEETLNSQPVEQKSPTLPVVVAISSNVATPPVSIQPVEQKPPSPEIDYSEKIQKILNNNEVFNGYNLQKIGKAYFIFNEKLGKNIDKVAKKLELGIYYIERMGGSRIDTESPVFQNKLQTLHNALLINVCCLVYIMGKNNNITMSDCVIGSITIPRAVLMESATQYKIPKLPVWQDNHIKKYQ